MRSATTVFLAGFALAILNRFRFVEGLGLVLLGLLQAWILNVIRITSMVAFAPHFRSGFQTDYLHDTAGLIVLLAVLLLVLEIIYWRARRKRRRPK